MLTAPDLSAYRIKEFIQFISNVISIVKEYDPKKLDVEKVLKSLSELFDGLSTSYKMDKSSDITPELSRLDDRRDGEIKLIRQVALAYLNHFDQSFVDAGETIVNCIDKYGKRIYDLNYEAQSAALTSLIDDFKTEKDCAAALTKLHQNEIVKDMEATNIQFGKLFLQRLKENSTYNDLPMKEIRKLNAEAYNKLTERIAALNVLNPSEELTALIKHLNENTEHFNNLIDRRQKNGNEPAEESDELPDLSITDEQSN